MTVEQPFNLQCKQRHQGWLDLSADIDWDSFPACAEHLADLLEAEIIDRQWGADLYAWKLDFEDTRLTLSFESNSLSLWLAIDREEEVEVLDFLESLLRRKLKTSGSAG